MVHKGAVKQNRLYRAYLFRFAIHIVPYILCAILICFCTMPLIVSGNLHRFFTAMPFAGIVIIPAFISLVPFSEQDYALPYTDTQIVFAKYAAAFTAMMAAVLCAGIIPVTLCLWKAAEPAQVLCAYSGIALYFLSAISLCLFLFTLVGHAGISFAISSAVLALASNMHLIASAAKLPAFVLSFCKLLSFSWHFDAAGKGILDSRDIAFYLICAALFFFAAVLLREKKRGYKNPLLHRLCCLPTRR